MFFNYTQTQDALEINQQRIKERKEENASDEFWCKNANDDKP